MAEGSSLRAYGMITLYFILENFREGHKFNANYHSFVDFLQSWDAYFRSNTYCAPPSLAPMQRNHVPLSQLVPMSGGALSAGAEPDEKMIDDHLAVQAIIRSYQVMQLSNIIHEFTITLQM